MQRKRPVKRPLFLFSDAVSDARVGIRLRQSGLRLRASAFECGFAALDKSLAHQARDGFWDACRAP